MRREELDDLAANVADGSPIQWDQVQTAADTAREREIVRQLAVLETIGRVHRESGALGTDLEPLHRWAHLEIRERLGGGSYGQVFRAWDPKLEREVALKLFSQRRDCGLLDWLRVVGEARRLARIRHPNVVTVFGAECAGEHVGIWMEFIQGRTLEQIVQQHGPLNGAEAALMGLSTCRALAAVHRAGLLHGDVKAANVMREHGGRLLLMDLGCSAVQGSGCAVAGTPLYLAPELLQGQPLSIRADIYSLGVLLFHLVTGSYPVNGRTLDEVRNAHAEGRRVLLHDVRPDLPAAFVGVVDTALAKEPTQRYESAGSMKAALRNALELAVSPRGREDSSLTRTRSWPRLLAGLALLAAAATLATLILGPWFEPSAPLFHRVTFRPGRVVTARFGNDSRTVMYSAQWNGKPAEVFISSSQSTQSRPLGLQDVTILSISRTGELAVLLRPRFLRGYVESGVLARVPMEGGAPRPLMDDVQEAAWAPDGKTLAIVRDAGGRNRLEFPPGAPIYETGGWISHVRIAPAGDPIAFIDHPTPADDSGAVAIVDRSGEKRTLSGGWVSAQGLAWSPEGDELWFTATRSGNVRALHAVDLRGNERLIYRAPEMLELQDVSRDGRVLLNVENTRVGVIARGAGSAEERDLSWLDWSLARDISEDGRMLLINESGEGGGANYGIYLRPIDGAAAIRLADGSGMALSPDGRWVLATTGTRPARLVLLPTGSGEPRPLSNGGLRYQQWGSWFSDGHRILFAAHEAGRGTRLFVRDTQGGSAAPITPEGVQLASADPLSPDETVVAALGPDQRVTIYPIDGRVGPRHVPGTEPGELPVRWSRDGRQLFVWQRGRAPARVYQVDVATGRRRLWRELMPPDPTGVHEVLRIVISQNPETYAYSYTRELSHLTIAEGLR